MSYSPTWTNANAQGRLEPGVHSIKLSDAEELVAAINRRRILTYQFDQDYSEQVQSEAYVRRTLINGAPSPPNDFRDALAADILDPPTGGFGGSPPTPASMEWLWPETGADENKVIVSGASEVGEGQVGLFQKLNGTSNWTDSTLTAGQTAIRAVHFNELRQSVEWISRGRWELPIYLTAGIFSPLPDTPWIGELIANNGTQELRSIGNAVVRSNESPPRGLQNATVRSSSYLELTADTDCTAEVYRCLRDIDLANDAPSWNEYAPIASAAWATPGGTGSGDATLIGSINLTAYETGSLSNAALTTTLQAILDGAEPYFLVRRSDTGSATISITGSVTIEFDLDTPPN